jgi:hypothetical protein
MICERRQGTRQVVIRQIETPAFKIVEHGPCPECEGFGIIACCEGSERYGQLPGDKVQRPGS